MSSTPKGLIGLVTHRIRGLSSQNRTLPEGLAEQYLALTDPEAAPNTAAIAEGLRAERLGETGNYTEALLAIDAALARSANNLLLRLRYKDILHSVALAVESLGLSQPESAEFGRAYELLMELGQVSIKMHLSAVYHYALSGKPTQALEVAVRLRNRSPNYPGLSEAIAFALQHQEDR